MNDQISPESKVMVVLNVLLPQMSGTPRLFTTTRERRAFRKVPRYPIFSANNNATSAVQQ
jgi:hypothetical protein